ncbi:SMI1/KNR4 family protein [Actinomadura rupiterrae]|uniref:SMI1/KNR4 family protein n=1 Tax=Actinomadura rupiterrae TaxID=559627 RepID=UPI0020A410F6|nr:SMI1/KNR4 family protein [Actinomadura rupiterrae]MCP2343182.1 cell wall assembly regulator SMI1 [Actinomadura rupiterrae]
MTAAVDESWDRIVAWLARHAPRSAELLGGPASAADLAEAQEAVGAELPGDLVHWWRRADGTTRPGRGRDLYLIPRFYPCSIQHALRSRRIWWQVWHDDTIERGWLAEEDFVGAQAGPAGSKAGMWLPGFLPIAGGVGGETLFVDLRTGPLHGCVREFDKVSTDLEPRWAGIADMLAEVADALENDTPLDGLRPHVPQDGVLYWDRGIQ